MRVREAEVKCGGGGWVGGGGGGGGVVVGCWVVGMRIVNGRRAGTPNYAELKNIRVKFLWGGEADEMFRGPPQVGFCQGELTGAVSRFNWGRLVSLSEKNWKRGRGKAKKRV